MAFYYPNKYFLNPSKSVPMGMDFFSLSRSSANRVGTPTCVPKVASTVGKNFV